MTRLKLFLIVIFCLVNGSASAASAITRHHPLVSLTTMMKVIRVHDCEERDAGWHVHGPKYFGGLGWLNATWKQWRAPSFPIRMDLATPVQQAWAMAHFVASVEHGWWPDQDGCTGGY